MIKKGIILAGGKGTRIKELSVELPKPMIPIGDKPILWHIMQTYAKFEHKDFYLALGYKAEYIKDFFLNQKAFTTDFTLDTTTHDAKFYLKNRTEVDDFKITFVDTGLDSLIGERILRCKEPLQYS